MSPTTQLARCNGLTESGGQIVERHDFFAVAAELSHDMAANVSGATGHQYRLVFHQIFARHEDLLNCYWFNRPKSINTRCRNSDLYRTLLC